ncbi:MAG TPA: hypothetical protein PKK23_02850 [Nitrospirales bacterium]|nr:thymidylate kinase-like protein [Nitrospiraceae bacterium]HNP27956.1 hypothetical protein [Nitrospirales bacterium]
MTDLDPRSSIVMKLFVALQAWNIPYVVVGDTRQFPSTITSDIDLVIASGLFQKFQHLLCDFCDEEKINFVQVLKHEYEAWYCVLAWHDKSGHLWFLHPDICCHYIRLGRSYLNSEELLAGRYQPKDNSGLERGFFVPRPSHAFIYYLIKKIEKGQLTSDDGEYLNIQWQRDVKQALSLVQRFWPMPLAEQLALAATENRWSNIDSHSFKFRESLRKRAPISVKGLWLEGQRKINRLCNPTGIFIVFLGPDGSGKSTVLNRVKERLAPAFRRTRYYHLRPNWRCFSRKTQATQSPHASPPRGVFASLFKLGLWWADYFIGYWLDIYRRLVSSTFVVFDRYYYDLLVDARRYRYGAPRCLAILVGKFIPKPDLVILLDAPPEILLQRKQEVEFEELVRQRAGYKKVVNSLPNGNIVDSSKPLDQVVIQVEQIVLTYMTARLRRRQGSKGKRVWM